MRSIPRLFVYEVVAGVCVVLEYCFMLVGLQGVGWSSSIVVVRLSNPSTLTSTPL